MHTELTSLFISLLLTTNIHSVRKHTVTPPQQPHPQQPKVFLLIKITIIHQHLRSDFKFPVQPRLNQ